ncbi:hypothetical protein ILUMI_15894 [Ignelater luminosus]|uniref:PiggyBac transposable element-derived protein domain-containing protein n=1 Tax=Ignelater luminosus TaxID=2038154 RepID=A0A8K0G8P2_IGNLU|nr:hypothetical protein ILUMI_15894 [Ignelater luminosus]
MDKMVSYYSKTRKTQRWPVAFSYNILDIAALAAYIIYTENNSPFQNQANYRGRFLKELEKQLSMSAILTRSKIPNVYRNFATRLGIKCVLDKPLVAADYEENPDSRNSPPRDATGLRKVVGNCFMFMSVAEKRFHKTRKLCSG